MITHRRFLPDLMKKLNLPMTGAELGVAEGYNSNDLLEGGLEKLYMVDAWQNLNQIGDGGNDQEWHEMNYQKALARVAKHGDKAVILRGLTSQMAAQVPDNSLGLLYLDARHDYLGVAEDLRLWLPKLIKGGICAGHDYLNRSYGVYQAVNEVYQSPYVIPEDKEEDAGFLFIKI